MKKKAYRPSQVKIHGDVAKAIRYHLITWTPYDYYTHSAFSVQW
jgi:hypothetical protein